MSHVADQTMAAGRDAVNRPIDEMAVRSECGSSRILA
jgi:hypothetical protein